MTTPRIIASTAMITIHLTTRTTTKTRKPVEKAPHRVGMGHVTSRCRM